MTMKKENNTLLIVLAIVAALLAAFNAYIALQQVSDLARITGYQIAGNRSTGNVTLSIPSNVQVLFTQNIINWSNGSVSSNAVNATLRTTRNLPDQVVNGTWVNGTGNGRDTGLVLRNLGNINVSITLNATKNYSTFFLPIGLDGVQYQWNITNNESGTCSGTAQAFTFSQWWSPNNTLGDLICRNMSYLDASNELRLDILLVIPQGVIKNQDYSDTITATATASTS